jgi:predicted NACHT family NTPase
MSVTSLGPLTAWLWDQYGKAISANASAVLRNRWKRFRWRNAAEAYRSKIITLCGSIQIMGMAEPVSLEDVFTDVYVLDQPTAFTRFDIERLKRMSADSNAPPHAKRINGLRLIVQKGKEKAERTDTKSGKGKPNLKGNVFILGKPGAGKTTFLKYIAIKAADRIIDKVPIFISLKEWADSNLELMPFIEERFTVCDFPDAQVFVEELLKSGSAIVLFDGLDEVNREGGQRDRQIFAINNFLEKYDRTQCIITCRIAANDYSFKPFTYLEIADFSERQIEAFVNSWFRQDGEKDKKTAGRFLRDFAKEENSGLRDLARTPLLLTLLCLAFGATLTFPRRRVDIYEEALDALLKKWDATKRVSRDEIYRKLSPGHKENLLASVAAKTFKNGEYFIPQSELERLIVEYVKNIPPHDTDEETDGEVILKAIEVQHGLFVERTHRVYSFSHLTFQEYYTARHRVATGDHNNLRELVEEHSTDVRWREVFLLTTSLLPDATQFMISFYEGTESLLSGDAALFDLLAWAKERSDAIQADQPWLARLAYLFIELFYPSRNPHLHTALTLALRRSSSIFECYQAIDLDRALARIVGRSHTLATDIDRPADLARNLGLNEFADALLSLSSAAKTTSSRRRTVLIDQLRQQMQIHRNIGQSWKLTQTQKMGLANYLNATYLLEDCLELATISLSTKKAIQNRLYFRSPCA